MHFASPVFIYIFLPAIIILFYIVKLVAGQGAARIFVLLSSIAFYAIGDINFLWLLIGSIVLNYNAGRAIEATQSVFVTRLAVAANLLFLGYFKYAAFIAGEIFSNDTVFASVILPLGISFFTFQQIGWLVDIYRGASRPESIWDHALFICFFPQLVAGPIVHHRDLVPQIKRISGLTGFTDPRLLSAAIYFFGGLAKKVLVADEIGDVINPLWANADSISPIDVWVATIGYGLQLYFDLSAYGEMAIGMALFFGITLPHNFNSPYKAASLRDFWRRWHITLGAFLRDYLYIPLGGSKQGLPRTLAALFITMLIGGIWHGAGWTFLLWGGLHGAGLCIETLGRQYGIRLPRLASQALTLVFVFLAWVPFRASSIDDAMAIYGAMLDPAIIQILLGQAVNTSTLRLDGYEFLVLLLLLLFTVSAPNLHETASRPPSFYRLAPMLVIASLFVGFAVGQTTDFIYWQW